jgi:hypothetical protein
MQAEVPGFLLPGCLNCKVSKLIDILLHDINLMLNIKYNV